MDNSLSEILLQSKANSVMELFTDFDKTRKLVSDSNRPRLTRINNRASNYFEARCDSYVDARDQKKKK